jgi:hypothetical protein
MDEASFMSRPPESKVMPLPISAVAGRDRSPLSRHTRTGGLELPPPTPTMPPNAPSRSFGAVQGAERHAKLCRLVRAYRREGFRGQVNRGGVGEIAGEVRRFPKQRTDAGRALVRPGKHQPPNLARAFHRSVPVEAICPGHHRRGGDLSGVVAGYLDVIEQADDHGAAQVAGSSGSPQCAGHLPARRRRIRGRPARPRHNPRPVPSMSGPSSFLAPRTLR